VVEEREERGALAHQVGGQLAVLVIDGLPAEQPIAARRELAPRHGEAVRRDLASVTPIAQRQGALQQRLDRVREPRRAAHGGLEVLVAAPQEVAEAGLMTGVLEGAVRSPAVPHQEASEVLAQDPRGLLEPAARLDRVDGDRLGHEHPQPLERAGDLPAGPSNPFSRATSSCSRSISRRRRWVSPVRRWWSRRVVSQSRRGHRAIGPPRVQPRRAPRRSSRA
jgi:hypothetical protein